MPSKVLYLGTDPSRFPREVVHVPLIQTNRLPLSEKTLAEFSAFTHILLTSPNAASILMDQFSLQEKEIFAIGKGTEEVLKSRGILCGAVAFPETQEGMIQLLKKEPLEHSYLFYPRSSLARPLLKDYLQEAHLKHHICDLYETVFLNPDPLPDLAEFDEIVFTSPSTVKAFLALYKTFPKSMKLTALGSVTATCL